MTDCPRCGSATPIGHSCIEDDLAAMRSDIDPVNRFEVVLKRLRAEHEAAVYAGGGGGGWTWSCSCGRKASGWGGVHHVVRRGMDQHLKNEHKKLLREVFS